MDIKELTAQIRAKRKKLDSLARRKLPVKVGRMAKDHYQENFRQGGFVDNGLHRWPATRRQQSGSRLASANYSPLLSRRNHLFSSVKYIVSDYKVRVSNEVPYASIHNFGGETHPAVTPKMRRFAWAMFYKEAGIRKAADGQKRPKKRTKKAIPPRAEMWKRMALTKKKRLNVRIPRRQFIGESAELNEKINKTVEEEITNILKL